MQIDGDEFENLGKMEISCKISIETLIRAVIIEELGTVI